MRRKKEASHNPTEKEATSRTTRRKRRSFFKWLCDWWNKNKNIPAGTQSLLDDDEYPLGI